MYAIKGMIKYWIILTYNIIRFGICLELMWLFRCCFIHYLWISWYSSHGGRLFDLAAFSALRKMQLIAPRQLLLYELEHQGYLQLRISTCWSFHGYRRRHLYEDCCRVCYSDWDHKYDWYWNNLICYLCNLCSLYGHDSHSEILLPAMRMLPSFSFVFSL